MNWPLTVLVLVLAVLPLIVSSWISLPLYCRLKLCGAQRQIDALHRLGIIAGPDVVVRGASHGVGVVLRPNDHEVAVVVGGHRLAGQHARTGQRALIDELVGRSGGRDAQQRPLLQLVHDQASGLVADGRVLLRARYALPNPFPHSIVLSRPRLSQP